jgi:hypothetical protein
MPRTINARLSGASAQGWACEAFGASSREQFCRDEERVEREVLERLKAELQRAFAAPEWANS